MRVDDGATLVSINLPLKDLITERFSRGHFPLFFIVYKYWVQLFGNSLLVLRLPATLACITTMLFTMEIARRLSGKWGMFLAGLFTIFQATLIRHSVECRMYSWMILFGAGLLWSIIWFLERPCGKRAILVGIFHLLLLQLHIGSILMTVPWFLSFFILSWRRLNEQNSMKELLGALIIPVLLTVPLYIHLLNSVHSSEAEKFVRPPVEFVYLLQVLFRISFGINLYGWGAELALGLTLPIACIGLLAWGKKRHPVSNQPLPSYQIALWLALCVWLTPTILYILEQFGVQMMGGARYYTPSTAASIALFTGALGSLHWKKSRKVIILNLCFLFIFYFGIKHMFYASRKMIKSKGLEINYMVEEVKKTIPQGTTVIIAHSRETPTIFRYYLGEENKDRYNYIELDRYLTFDQMNEIIAEKTTPEEDLLLFLYKELPQDLKVEKLVRTQFGPWKEITQNKEEQPKWVWLKR
jgi:Dolichyl-phosphate-mannose-protein mannosyltransferase